MTLLGKVFTCLVLMMSAIFFTFSVVVNASHVNVKEKSAEYEQQSRDVQARNTQLETLKNHYKEELAIEQQSRRSALAALQTQYEAAENRLLVLETQAAELRSNLSAAARTNDSTHGDLRAAADANRKIREQIAEARQKRDELFSSLLKAREEFTQLQGVNQALADRAGSLDL